MAPNTRWVSLNQSENLDPSYKPDLDFWVVMEGKTPSLIAELHGQDRY